MNHEPLQTNDTPLRELPTWAYAAVLLLITACVFGRVCGFDFVTWDDSIHVYNNPFFQPVTWAHVAHFWLAPYQMLYIPLSYTIYAGLVLIASHFPVGFDKATGTTIDAHVFHIASLLIHLVNTYLVFEIVRRISRSSVAAFYGTLIFAIHPLQVESVAWISELRGLLSAMFCLGAILWYIREERPAARCWLVAGAFMLLALLCKPSALVLPLMLLAIGWLVQGRSLATCAKETLPLLLIGIPFLAITHSAQPVPADITVPLFERPLIAGDALAFYLAKLFVPVNLCIDYSRKPHVVVGHWWGFLTWLLPAAVVGASWYWRRSVPSLLPGLAIFAIVLLPVLGLVPFNYQNFSTVADRYTYLALLGPALIVGALAATRVWRRSFAYAAGTLAILLGVLAVGQVKHWHNSFDLNQSCIAVNPNSAACHANYGDSLFRLDEYPAARDEYITSIRDNPDFEYLYTDLGDVYMKMKSYEDAVNCYTYAAYRHQSNPRQHCKLANAYLAENRPEDAIKEFLIAVKLAPRDSSVLIGLGDACMAARHPADAVISYQAAIMMGAQDAATRSKLAVATAKSRK